MAKEGRLNELPSYSPTDRSPMSLFDVLCNSRIKKPLFCANVSLDPLIYNGESYTFDGLSRIDCLIYESNNGIAMEIKLGITRMTPAEFGKRFLKSSECSAHVPPRIKGNMISVLDGRFSREEFAHCPLTTQINRCQKISVAADWLLLVRKSVWERWAKQPPQFRKHCRVLVFEDFVTAVGGTQIFDDIVQQLVGGEFALAWNLVPAHGSCHGE